MFIFWGILMLDIDKSIKEFSLLWQVFIDFYYVPTIVEGHRYSKVSNTWFLPSCNPPVNKMEYKGHDFQGSMK